MLIDTHAHLFLEEFADDCRQVMERAREAGVERILMPNIDVSTLEPLMRVCSAYPQLCSPMIGLHPTSVNEDYARQLEVLKGYLIPGHPFVAIGEVGLDLYWDRSFLKEQLVAFETQLQWALEMNLPLVIHAREAFDYIYKVMEPYRNTPLRGVFHSFTGTEEEARRCLEFENFMLGVNGVLTFKKSTLPQVLTAQVPMDRLVLETDAPYLTPVPHRGKRNESAYVALTLAKLAEVYETDVDEMKKVTGENASKVFDLQK